MVRPVSRLHPRLCVRMEVGEVCVVEAGADLRLLQREPVEVTARLEPAGGRLVEPQARPPPGVTLSASPPYASRRACPAR
jgi:hypothetical protein